MVSNKKIEIFKKSWQLNKSFNISRSSKLSAETVEVKISDGNFVGRGECVPYGHYNESTDTVSKQLEDLIDFQNINGLSTENLHNFLPPGAARNAIDCALWDLKCKIEKTSIWSLLNIKVPQTLPSSYTIVLDKPDIMIEDALKNNFYPTIKVKVDCNNLEFILTKIREQLPNASLIIDANEAFDIEVLRDNLELFNKISVDLIEQPLPHNNDQPLLDLNSTIPICADESFHTIDDFNNIKGKYDSVNIKLDKTGGLTEALKIVQKAERNKLKCMVGCMVSTSLSMLPAAILYSKVNFLDLDGPCFLIKDQENGISYEQGKMIFKNEMCWG